MESKACHFPANYGLAEVVNQRDEIQTFNYSCLLNVIFGSC
jgi:hypothetical protein